LLGHGLRSVYAVVGDAADVQPDREYDPVYTGAIPGLYDGGATGTADLGGSHVAHRLPTVLGLFTAVFVKGVFIG
jgi:hypothetical protein